MKKRNFVQTGSRRRLELLGDRPVENQAKLAAVEMVRHWRERGFEKVQVLGVPHEMLREVVPQMLIEGWHLGAIGDLAGWFAASLFQAAFPSANEARAMDALRLWGVLYLGGAYAMNFCAEGGVRLLGTGFEFKEDGVDVQRAEPIVVAFLYAEVPVRAPDAADGDEPAPVRIGVTIPRGRLISELCRGKGDDLQLHETWGQRLGRNLADAVLKRVKVPTGDAPEDQEPPQESPSNEG